MNRLSSSCSQLDAVARHELAGRITTASAGASRGERKRSFLRAFRLKLQGVTDAHARQALRRVTRRWFRYPR